MPQYNFIDLSGQTFERLIVLQRHSEDKLSPSGQKHVQWLCRCSCGNLVIVQTQLLRSGRTKSCGCYKSETMKKRMYKNLEGHRFGQLTVLKRDEVYVSPTGRRKSKWICQCDCGTIISTLESSLLRELSTSCGCLRESKMAHQLKEYFSKNYSAIPEYKILKNSENGYWLPFDLYIPDGIFIEVHGLQHYQRSEFFQGNKEFERRQHLDKIKKNFAKMVGIYIEIDMRKIKTVQDAIAYIENQL